MIASRKTSLLKEIDFTQEVTLLVAATLEAFDKGYRAAVSRREDPISRKLVFALLRLQSKDGWEWLGDYVINGQRDELDADLEAHLGRTDITFNWDVTTGSSGSANGCITMERPCTANIERMV